MSKYSDDSDSSYEKRSSKKSYSRRSRERSYSSDSSSSKNRKHKDKKYKRDRSKSRGSDKYSRSSRGEKSSSSHKTKYSKSRYYSPDRSSKDRYKSKYKSKERSRRSPSDSRYRQSKKSENRDSNRYDKSPSTTSSSSSSLEKDSLKTKEIVGSQLDTSKSILKPSTVDDITKVNIINEINEDSFTPKQFVSSKGNKKVSDSIVIDLKSQTIKVPDVEITEPDSIFHPNLFANEETRMEKWVKELYIYRQKALNGEIINI